MLPNSPSRLSRLSHIPHTLPRPISRPTPLLPPPREEWQFGAREDWRFLDMSASCGGPQRWWWLSFFAAYLSQHALLMGVTWPLLVVHQVPAPWHPLWDTLAAAAAVSGGWGRAAEGVRGDNAPYASAVASNDCEYCRLTSPLTALAPLPWLPSGILIASIADTQLQAFKVRNELLRLNGYPATLINRQGEPPPLKQGWSHDVVQAPVMWSMRPPVHLPTPGRAGLADCNSHLCRPLPLLAPPQLLWGVAVVVGPGRLCGAPGAALGDGRRGPQHARYGEIRGVAEGLPRSLFCAYTRCFCEQLVLVWGHVVSLP